MLDLGTCSNCWYRQTCNLDGHTAKTCGMWTPWKPGDYLLKWSRSLRRESSLLLVEFTELSNSLAELRAQRDAEQQRGVDAKP